MDGFRNLAEGQRVSFDPEKDEKGLRAKNVRKIE
jgi:cold shock CspA family protein